MVEHQAVVSRERGVLLRLQLLRLFAWKCSNDQEWDSAVGLTRSDCTRGPFCEMVAEESRWPRCYELLTRVLGSLFRGKGGAGIGAKVSPSYCGEFWLA